MTILVLTVGSISIVATSHLAVADQKGEVCVFFACGNANITGGTSSSGGGGGQPTPSTATLIVTKALVCPPLGCGDVTPNLFQITVTGNNPSPDSFKGSTKGTTVTLGPGKYTVSEPKSSLVSATFSGNCVQDATDPFSATGNINAGDIQTCTIINNLFPRS